MASCELCAHCPCHSPTTNTSGIMIRTKTQIPHRSLSQSKMTNWPIFPHHRTHRMSYNDIQKTRFVLPGQFDDAEEEIERVQQAPLPIFQEVSPPRAKPLKPTHAPNTGKSDMELSARIDNTTIESASSDKDATPPNKKSSDQFPPILTKKFLTKLPMKHFIPAQPTISRAAKVKSKMTSSKKKSSGSIGVYHRRWSMKFHELSVYRRERGHCRVPQHYPVNPKLGTWVHNQRQKYKLGVLTEERKNMLDRLGFKWEVSRGGERADYPFDGRFKNWEIMFSEMASFRETHGHCNIPNKGEYRSDYSQLRKWSSLQRYWYKKFIAGYQSKLPRERVEMLDSIGFSWGVG